MMESFGAKKVCSVEWRRTWSSRDEETVEHFWNSPWSSGLTVRLRCKRPVLCWKHQFPIKNWS